MIYILESIYERAWDVISSTTNQKTKREEKENDSILVENHTKCIGFRPTRPFSAYQTICASDLFPWQRNLEVVYSATIDPSSLPRNWRFTFPFCSCNQERHSFCATWKCQTRAQLGKEEAYQLLLKSEQRKNFRSKERTTFISLHALCTQCFVRFSVSPTCLRANFWWIAPIRPFLVPSLQYQVLHNKWDKFFSEIISAFGSYQKGRPFLARG